MYTTTTRSVLPPVFSVFMPNKKRRTKKKKSIEDRGLTMTFR